MLAGQCRTEQDQIFSRFALRTMTVEKKRGQALYSQGDPANTVFYLQRGHVKLTVLSECGKQGVVGVVGPASFFGYACLSGQKFMESTATAVSECIATKIERGEMMRALDREPRFCQILLSYILSRNIQLEADLADHLCNPCDRRLARTLRRLAALDGSSESAQLLSKIDQHTLAGMVGTSQPRISILLSRFKKQGFIVYDTGLQVSSRPRTT